MMTSALMNELARQNVRLLTDGEQLTIRAPKGVVTAELRLELASQKANVIAMLLERRNGNSHLPRIAPRLSERYEPFPLTEIQKAYVVGRDGAFDLGNVSCHVYYEVDAIRPDMDRFNRALQLLIDRHDMLRAVVLPGGRQQVLEKVPPYQISMLDLRHQDAREAQSKLDSIRADMSHEVRPADRWPLFDCRASRLDEERVRLHLSFDTLIVDVWSLRVLFQEWRELYQDPKAKLVPLDIAFREYVLAEPMLRASKEFARSSDYWSKRLSSLPAGPELPLL